MINNNKTNSSHVCMDRRTHANGRTYAWKCRRRYCSVRISVLFCDFFHLFFSNNNSFNSLTCRRTQTHTHANTHTYIRTAFGFLFRLEWSIAYKQQPLWKFSDSDPNGNNIWIKHIKWAGTFRSSVSVVSWMCFPFKCRILYQQFNAAKMHISHPVERW